MKFISTRFVRSLPRSLLRHAGAAALATLLAGTAHAFPGELDLSYGTNGIASRTVNSSDFAHAATGVGALYVTGGTSRGTMSHLFVARFATNGTLDATFGTAGRTMLRLDQPSDGMAIRTQPDGKIVVAGALNNSSAPETLVVRFNTDGTLDTTFAAATSGVYTRKIGGYSTGSTLALQVDGKILVGGTSSSATFDGYVLRLNADGTTDAAFGVNGVKTLDWRGGFDVVNAVAEFAGKIYVAGGAANGPSGALNYGYARLNADGSVDTTFGPPGQNGLVLLAVDGQYDIANAFLFDGLGSMYVGGTSQRAGETRYSMSVVKMDTNGIPVAGWGNNGRAFASFSGDTFAYSMAASPAGVVIAGSRSGRFAMARFNPAGALDPTFGTGGIVEDTEGTGNGIATLSTPDAVSYMAVGAGTETGDPNRADILRVRYTANGARDATYGTGGRTLTNLYTPSWDLRAVAARADGSILVAGTLSDAFDSDFVVAALKADGSFDSFGQGGLSTAGFGKTDDRGNALLVRPDGSIVVAGRSVNLGTGSFALAGFTSLGNRDYAFGQNGRVSHTMGIGYAEIYALANAPGNKFVAAGYALVGSGNNDFAVARYNANGSLDATFGTGGVVITPFGALSDVAQAVAVQPDGKVVAAGYARTGSFFDFALVRYNTDGSLDASFGTGGKVTLSTVASNDMVHAIALLADGRILVAGEAFLGSNNFMVARLNANGSLDTTFGVSGLAMVDMAGGADAAWSMAVQADGKIVLAGTGYDGFSNGFALVRLTANGSLDGTTFGSFGYGTSFVDVTGTIDTAYGVAIQPDLRIVVVGTAGTGFAVARFFGEDTIPDPFTFPTQVDVMPLSLVVSGPAMITGIAAPSPISIQGGNYSIGCTGTWVSTPGFVSNGQTICLRHIAQNALGATTQNWVTVGGVTGIFSSVTVTTLDPAGDYDNDGIPNGIEPGENRNPLFKDNDVFANARLFVMQQYRDFLGREGDAGGIQGWTDAVTTGMWTRAQVIDAFLTSPEFAGSMAPVVRLYFAAFQRVPDYPGLMYNAGLVRNGTVTLTQLADYFTTSAEFVATFGALDNTQFVTLLYTNLLGRTPDPGGLAAWVNLLDTGTTRGQVLLGFSESGEYQTSMASEVFVTMMYAGMLHRTPDAAGFSAWVAALDAGPMTHDQVIGGFFLCAEYHARFLP